MKIKIILFIQILISVSFAFSQNTIFDWLDIRRIDTDFNGSCYNGEALLVYGTNGVILRSFDLGKKWSNIQLNEIYDIINMENINNSLIALTKNGVILKSIDNGSNWEEFNIGNDTTYYKMIIFQNNLYCSSYSGITVLNSDLKKIKHYSLQLDTTYYSFTIFQNKIIYSSGIGKLGLIDIQNDQSTIIDLKAIGLCSDCSIPNILTNNNDKLFFSIKSDLFMYDGTNFIKTVKPIKLSCPFTINEDELLQIYSIYNPSIGVDSLYYNKIDFKSNTIIRINKQENDRYIKNLDFLNMDYITENIIIAVGKNKLIYMSFDKGQNWNLKSYFIPQFNYRCNNNYAIIAQNNVQFFSTRDGGNTWLPQKNYDTLFLKIGFDIFGNIKFFAFDSNTSLLFKHSIYKTTNLAYTLDGGETVHLKEESILAGYKNELIPTDNFPICSNHNKIILTFPGYIDTTWKFTILYVFSKDIELEKRILMDSVLFIYINSNNDNELIAFVKNHKYNNRQYSLLKSLDTGSTWTEMIRLGIFDTVVHFDYITLDGDFLYITTTYPINNEKYIYKGCVYQIDLKKLTTKLFFELENTNIYFVSEIDNSYLMSGCRIYRIEKKILPFIAKKDLNSSQPDDYVDITPNIGRNTIYWFAERKKERLTMIAQENPLKINGVWFVDLKLPSTIDYRTNELNSLYISNPEPNPASDFVKFRIWWETPFIPDKNKIRIADIYGRYLINQEISLNEVNSYSGIINWNISNISNGIYFLVVSLGNDIKSIPVIVDK